MYRGSEDPEEANWILLYLQEEIFKLNSGWKGGFKERKKVDKLNPLLLLFLQLQPPTTTKETAIPPFSHHFPSPVHPMLPFG